MAVFNHLDFINTPDMEEVSGLLSLHGCRIALIKRLAKNNNDKNQIYFHHDTSILNSVFDLTFEEREPSTSVTKRRSEKGKSISSAVFNNFSWLDTAGELHRAKNCKGITYHQYPEMRLSGFQTKGHEMPRALTVEYTKREDALPRYLVIGATAQGKAVAMLLTNPAQSLVSSFDSLEQFAGSSICKLLPIARLPQPKSNEKKIAPKQLTFELYEQALAGYQPTHLGPEIHSNTIRLEKLLVERIIGKSLKGCRFDKHGNTIPFIGTQVHGYTLEHALDITPNTNHNGDIFGIELKCFTAKKLSLITTEPDGGLYNSDFVEFMTTYGYPKDDDHRFTGIHRAYQRNDKTGLTLKIVCEPVTKKNPSVPATKYDPNIVFAKQMNRMQVVLEDDRGGIAASWSIEHLMNRWGAKHNEVVYVPATVFKNNISEEFSKGYKKRVQFDRKVIWCFRSTIEKLVNSIHEGVIFLDPGHKYSASDSQETKRRTQWRLNNIYKVVSSLYEESELRELG